MSRGLVVLFTACAACAVAATSSTTTLESQHEFREQRIDPVPLGSGSSSLQGYRLPDLNWSGYARHSMTFSPDGKWLAAGYWPPRLFALEAGRPPALQFSLNDTHWPDEHFEPPPLAFSGDSKWLATMVPLMEAGGDAQNGSEVRIYALNAGGPPTLQLSHRLNFCADDVMLSADSKWLLIKGVDGDDDPNWNLYEIEGARHLQLLATFDAYSTVAFSGDAKWLATIQWLAGVSRAEVYALEAGSRPALRATLNDRYAEKLAFSPDSNWIVVAGEKVNVYTLNGLIGVFDTNFHHDIPVFSGDSKWLAAGNKSAVQMYALDLGRSPKLRFNLSNAYCYKECGSQGRFIPQQGLLRFSKDAKWLASVFVKKLKVYYRELDDSQPILRFTLDLVQMPYYDKSFVTPLFSGDSKWLASIQVGWIDDQTPVRTVVLYDLETSPGVIVI